MSELRFAYSSWNAIILISCISVAIFGVAGAAFSGSHEFAAGVATGLRGLVLLNVVVTPVALYLAYRRIKSGQRFVVLGADALEVPVGLFGGGVQRIPYTQIDDVRLVPVRRSAVLAVRHEGGRVRIPDSAVPDIEQFKTLFEQLIVRVKAVNNG